MATEKLISKLLRLKDVRITFFNFRHRENEFHIGVKPFKNGCRCPDCGRRGKIVARNESRSWSDIVVAGWKVVFHYSPKVIYCPTHGKLQEDIPWAATSSHCTYRFEYIMLTLSNSMTQKEVANLLKIPSSTLSNRLHRVISRERAGHKIRGVTTIGIDEISYCKRHKYATIVYDLDKAVVLWVGKGKGRSTIDRFFNNCLSDYQKGNIKWASCDMSDAFIEAIKFHCKNAKLVLDRFHIVQGLNKAVDEVRKDVWREAAGNARKAIKGLRWILYRHSSSRTKGDTRKLNNLRGGNRKIHRAWVLKDEFEHFWDYNSLTWAESFLKGWITSALKSRIPSMKKVALTLRKYQDNILTFIERNLTNAVAEGLNRVIKIIKGRSSGFKNLESFADLIFLRVGDLDIPSRIPSRYRIL